MDTYLGKSHQQHADHFRKLMNKYEYGSEKYEQARKIFAWLVEKIREKQKLELLK